MNPFFPECKHSWADEIGIAENLKIGAEVETFDKGSCGENTEKGVGQCDDKIQDVFNEGRVNGSSPFRTSFNTLAGFKEEKGENSELPVKKSCNWRGKDISLRYSNEIKINKELELFKLNKSEDLERNEKKIIFPIKENFLKKPKSSPSLQTSERLEARSSLRLDKNPKNFQLKKPPPDIELDFGFKLKTSEQPGRLSMPYVTPVQRNRTSLIKSEFRTPNLQSSEKKFTADRETLQETKKLLVKVQVESEKESFLNTLGDLLKLEEMIDIYFESALKREELARYLLEMHIEEIPEIDSVILDF